MVVYLNESSLDLIIIFRTLKIIDELTKNITEVVKKTISVGA